MISDGLFLLTNNSNCFQTSKFPFLKSTCQNQRLKLEFTAYRVGVWRSLVAHLHGVQGVEGSNPFTPTKELERAVFENGSFFRLDDLSE